MQTVMGSLRPAEEEGVSFQEHAEIWGFFFFFLFSFFFFNPTETSVEAWGGVVYWEHIRL